MEQGLCSKGSEFLALSRNFVCVRLYYTAKGASEPFGRLGLGNPGGPRNNVDLAFLAPDGRNIDVRTLKPVQGPQEGVLVRDLVASLTRPVKELKAFQRVRISAGETKVVELELPVASLGFHDAAMRYVVEPGAFHLWVGGDSASGLESGFEVVE